MYKLYVLNMIIDIIKLLGKISSEVTTQNVIIHIYQPLRSGRIWHKVNI